jgi:Tfp pilus assembly protein FimV
MEVLTGLFILAVCGIVGDTIVKVAKSRAGAATSKALRGELDEMSQLLQDQSAALADAQATIASQAESIQELHERVDFAERILTQVKEKGALGRG